MAEKKYLYEPRLEEVRTTNNSEHTVNVWDDWGLHGTKEDALECQKEVINAIRNGRYPILPGHHHAFCIGIYVDDPDEIHLVSVDEIIPNIEKIS